MLQEPSPQQYELEMVTMEQLVPKNHLVRKIDKVIDFEFIRDEVAHLYCKDNGRPPVDPVRLFKIILLGYLFGIKSERQLVKEIEVNVAYRWFLRMSLTEKVIHASTLSQNRIRRFNGTDIFERIFINIVEQAMAKGLVAGQQLFTDSTHLKANANKNKHTNEVREVRASAYLDMLDEDVALDREKEGKKPLKARESEPKIKNTKVSTTDPESGFMTRDNKPQGFFYLDHRTVDGLHGIIVDTHTTAGNVNDSQPYVGRLDYTLERFNLNPIAVGLDAGYFTAPVAESLERRSILGVFGYRRPSRTKNTFKKKHFIYHKGSDSYQCPNGQNLIYKTTSRDAYREYHSDPKECAFCPLRKDCTQSKNMKKVITRHIYTDAVERANEMRLSPYGKKTYRRRSETVERSFADAKQHHGHRYARFRGLTNVQMQCWLAATAQNIKKIVLVVSYLRKNGLNMPQIRQILAFCCQLKNWVLPNFA
ncbi:IS1182 family transposase [Vibrio penaeicida]|uniref:IS1182 family transposase n=1 Tax=Vibrio penaeicida TaxID=104609 RepID=UPI001CC764CE|nr:IS1182 family transposase [Vibrio penaeicida]